MQWCHWWHCWHHVTLTPASMASLDQNDYVEHCFYCVDLMNVMLLLMIPLASHHTEASANSVKWLKSHVASHLWSSSCNKCNVVFMMPSVSCDTNTGIIRPKRSCCTLFQLSWPIKLSGATENGNSAMWCWHWCHQHHMTKQFIWHLVSIVFT